ncbi:hypothetical protein C8R47DRAFT_1248401 [Mycena vitilis]|nr:hypothetical protein C8R47DRAFT_1248401 [Mycena vitilis]
MRINDETVLVDAPIYGSTSHHRSLPQPPHASGSAAPPLRPQFANPPHHQNLPFPNLSSPRRHSRRSRTPDLMEDTEGQFMGQLTSSDEDDFTSSSESQHRSPRMKSAVPLFGSSNRTVLDMPLRGSRDAPKTFRGHHSEVEYFIAHYDRLLVKFHVNDPEDQCRLILDYCATDVQGFIRASKYFQQNRWPKRRIEILQCYDTDKAISRYKPSDIATYTLRTKSHPFQNLSQWKKYYIKYKTMAGILLQQGHITQANYDVYFWLGIEQDLRRTLEQRINQLNPSRNVHRQYSVREINIAAECGTSEAETEDESDIDSDDSDYENYRRKHRAKARAKKEKEKKKKKKTANAPASGKSRIVSTSGTAEEVTSLIRQLNKMTITDPEYAPVYYRVLTLDTTGVAAKCVQPPRLPQPWQERPSQKGNQAPTPTTGATGGSSGAPGPTTYPNNIPVPTGCYGCGLDGHRIGECSEIRELKAKNVIKVDETTRRVRGRKLAAAARRQAAPRVMFTSARQYAASDSDESSAAFIEDYPAAVDTSDIESEVEYREDVELDVYWYVADSDHEVRDCQKTPGDVYLTVPGPIVELEPDDACVNAAERTLPSTRAARRDIFDGVMLPRRERAKNDPEPAKVSPAPQESTRNKKEQAPRQAKDLLPELTPVVAKRGNPSPSSDKGPTKENNDPQKAKHQMENPSKNTGRYSDLQAGVQIPSIVDRILDLTIPLTVREVFVASKEVRSGIMDVMRFKNIKAVLLGKSEDNPIVAHWGEHDAASYKGSLIDNLPVHFASSYEIPPTQNPRMPSRFPSPPASSPHHPPSPKNESPTDAVQDEVHRFLATLRTPPLAPIPGDVLSRTRTHHFGRVDTHPRSGTNHQRVHAATDLQWAAFRRGHELTVRPGSVVSPQTVYTGREVRSNGQEVHHAVLLNARLLVHNPDSGEPGMQNGHAMVHFYTAPRADVAWELETPYASADSVSRQLQGYSAAIHQEVGRQRRAGKFTIDAERQIKEIYSPPPPTPFPRAMSSPRRPISPLAKLLPARLPLRRSGAETPPEHFRYLTYPARTPPRTRPANSLSTNYIEVDTGNRVLALPTSAHPHLDASPRPGTPGLPGRLHEGRPKLRRAHSSDDAMEDVIPAPPAPSAPSAPAEQLAAPVPRPSALTKERINKVRTWMSSQQTPSNAQAEKLNAEALRRAIERRVGLSSGVPCVLQDLDNGCLLKIQGSSIEQEQAAAVESDGESLGSTDTWSVSSSDEDDPMGGSSAKENAAVLAVDGGHDDNGHEGETQGGRTGPESRAERSRAGKRLPFGAANTGPGTGPQGDASRRHPTFSSTSVSFPPPSFSPSPPSLSPPPAPRLRTIPLPSASASEAESGDYFSIDHHRDDYDHRDDRDPRSPSSGRRSTLLTPDRPLFTTEPLASAARSTSSLLSSLSTSIPSLISFRSGPSAFHFVLQDELNPQPAATTKNVSDRGELQLSQRSPAGHAIVDEPLLNFNISCVWDGIPSAVFEPTEMTLDLPRMRRIIARHDATIARRRQDQNTKVKAVIERAVQAYDYCAPYLDFDAMDRAEMVVIDTYQHVPTKRKTWQEVQERVDHEEVMKKFLATISTDCGDGTRRVRDDLGVPVSEDGDRVRALSVAAMLNGAMYRLAILLFAQPRLMEIARVAALRARVLHVTFECDALADTRGIAYDETLLHQPAPFPPPFLHGIEYMHLRLLMYMFAREGDFEISDGIAQILKYRLREPAVITHFLCAGLLDPNDTVVREGVANDTWNAPSSVFNSLV